MTELELALRALDAGILPSFDSDEIKHLFETCDPQDAYRMKRKFRKLWRKARRKEIHQAIGFEGKDKALTLRIKEAYKIPARRRQQVKNGLKND